MSPHSAVTGKQSAQVVAQPLDGVSDLSRNQFIGHISNGLTHPASTHRRWHTVQGDGVLTELAQLNTHLGKYVLCITDGEYSSAVHLHEFGNQQSLRAHWLLRCPGTELLKQNPLVTRVLIDNH
jgi:hypothetical protein